MVPFIAREDDVVQSEPFGGPLILGATVGGDNGFSLAVTEAPVEETFQSSFSEAIYCNGSSRED